MKLVQKKYKKGLVWLRHDLRLSDHIPLQTACSLCDEVQLVFIFDSEILDTLAKDDCRVTFIYDCLEDLRGSLKARRDCLKLFYGRAVDLIPRLATGLGVEVVFTGEDYEPLAIARDRFVGQRLGEIGVVFYPMKDSVIFHKDDVMKGDGQPYKVFTPYKRQWLKQVNSRQRVKKPNLKKLRPWPEIDAAGEVNDPQEFGFIRNPCDEPAGEKGALLRLRAFRTGLTSYHERRNFPAIQGTSNLSMHLRFGTVGIRTLVDWAIEDASEGAEVWLSELIWREFYKAILYHCPWVVSGPFQRKYDQLHWPSNPHWFKKWQDGETGYPIIDAAMRHFAATGKMHNRLRMVVAQFLTKDLLTHWRHGEDYFAQKLLDFDLSANSGGWQWSASVGCDAQPYFRIFNPSLQSKRFDPNGEFIKRHLPELAAVPAPQIHDPQKLAPHRPKSYPRPLVVHKEMAAEAKAMFRGEGFS